MYSSRQAHTGGGVHRVDNHMSVCSVWYNYRDYMWYAIRIRPVKTESFYLFVLQ